jgi:hypothetical protein
MKTTIVTFVMTLFVTFIFSQKDTTIQKIDTNTYRVVTTDGKGIIGKILSQDAREILILTRDNREVYVPQYVVREVVRVDFSKFNAQGVYVGEDKFATRYFITTNGLPIKRGEHYVQWSLFGGDFQFGLGDHFGVGLMTSWIGMPIIGTIKKSWQLEEDIHFALGGLIGTGSWLRPGFGGALPFGTLSFGDRRANIAFSGGYGAVWDDGSTNGRAIFSVAGMVKVGPKISLVFDSFIMTPGPDQVQTYTEYDGSTYTNVYKRQGFTLLIPGIRWHQDEGKAFQFGFTGLIINGDLLPVPIPTFMWYRSL